MDQPPESQPLGHTIMYDHQNASYIQVPHSGIPMMGMPMMQGMTGLPMQYQPAPVNFQNLQTIQALQSHLPVGMPHMLGGGGVPIPSAASQQFGGAKGRGKKCVQCHEVIAAASATCPKCQYVYRITKSVTAPPKPSSGQRGKKPCRKCKAVVPAASATCKECGYVFRVTIAQSTNGRGRRPQDDDDDYDDDEDEDDESYEPDDLDDEYDEGDDDEDDE